MDNETLIVQRIWGREDKYVMYVRNTENGQILRTSNDLTENQVRSRLRDSGKTELQIETRILSAQSQPATCICCYRADCSDPLHLMRE